VARESGHPAARQDAARFQESREPCGAFGFKKNRGAPPVTDLRRTREQTNSVTGAVAFGDRADVSNQ